MTNSATGADMPILPPCVRWPQSGVARVGRAGGDQGFRFLHMCAYVEIARYAAMLLDEHYILLFCILRHWRPPAEGVSIPR
jgi:hypothetical protein